MNDEHEKKTNVSIFQSFLSYSVIYHAFTPSFDYRIQKKISLNSLNIHVTEVVIISQIINIPSRLSSEVFYEMKARRNILQVCRCVFVKMKEEGAKAISIFMAFSFVFIYIVCRYIMCVPLSMWQILNAFRPSWWQLTINYLNLFINFFVFFPFCPLSSVPYTQKTFLLFFCAFSLCFYFIIFYFIAHWTDPSFILSSCICLFRIQINKKKHSNAFSSNETKVIKALRGQTRRTTICFFVFFLSCLYVNFC